MKVFLRLHLTCLLAVALIGSSGCVVPSRVTWMPDSSGFVYTERDSSRLVHYDLGKKARRVIVEDTKTRTPWPAVSPDGTRVAVARWTETKGSRTVKLVVYQHDFKSGKLLKESRVLEWDRKDPAKSAGVGETGLVWGDSRHILLIGHMIYDLERDELRTSLSTAFYLANSPVRPDRKGFLAFRDGPNQSTIFTFVDWMGKERQIGKPLLEKDAKDLSFELSWDGDIANVGYFNKNRLRLDTQKGTATWKNDSLPRLLPTTGKLLAIHAFLATERYLCIFEHKDAGTTENDFRRIEFHDLATKRRTVVIDKCNVAFWFDPSPDGKAVACRITGSGDQPDRILVVGANGKLMSSVDAAR